MTAKSMSFNSPPFLPSQKTNPHGLLVPPFMGQVGTMEGMSRLEKDYKMNLNEALEILGNGNEDKAWEVAQQDEGLNEGVTKEQWLDFAYKAIERRKAEAEMHKNAVYID